MYGVFLVLRLFFLWFFWTKKFCVCFWKTINVETLFSNILGYVHKSLCFFGFLNAAAAVFLSLLFKMYGGASGDWFFLYPFFLWFSFRFFFFTFYTFKFQSREVVFYIFYSCDFPTKCHWLDLNSKIVFVFWLALTLSKMHIRRRDGILWLISVWFLSLFFNYVCNCFKLSVYCVVCLFELF